MLDSARSGVRGRSPSDRTREWAGIRDRRAATPYRLARTVVPVRYDLTLEPDLDRGIFSGSVSIRLDVREPLSEIVVNAAQLELDEAHVVDERNARTGARGVIAVDAATERASIGLPAEIPPGAYTLRIAFRGVLNDKLLGFYRSRFTTANGEQHVIAATQMQGTNARRVFPCFDEPAFKAVFAVTLVVPAELDCVSNAGVAERTRAGGTCAVRFLDTIPMSPYLVAFAVGPLEFTEAVDVGGVRLRTVTAREKRHLTGFAQTFAAFALRYCAAKYGLAYPGEKLDQVAVPDFAAAGMENFGCITYREAVLLLDPRRATAAELVRSADVIAHEIAHMWFGDLVTMEWWNGLWLNEAFATFMSAACVDAYDPEWDRWTQFSLDRSKAFDVDALESTRTLEYPVESPLQALGMLDVLTYQKGASLLRMLEQFVGTEQFFAGVRLYLEEHAYGNAAADDLWRALEHVTGRPVTRLMSSWVHQKGYPVLTAALSEDRTVLTIAQQRFRFAHAETADETTFVVPLRIRAYGPGGCADHTALIEDASAELVFADPVDAVVVNAGADGFYRVRYAPHMLQSLLSCSAVRLSAAERYALVDDAWAGVLQGSSTAEQFLELAARADETDPSVWALLCTAFDGLERLLEGEARAAYRARIRQLVSPAHRRLMRMGNDTGSPRARELRGVVMRVLGIIVRDDGAIAESRALHDRYVRDPASVAPNVAAAAADVVAYNGGDDDYDRFAGRCTHAATPQDVLRYQRCLSAFPHERHMDRTLAMCVDGTVRSQDAPHLLGACLRNRDHGMRAWRFVERHWEYVNRVYSPIAIAPFLAGVTALSRPEQAEEVQAFLGAHDVPQGRLAVRQHLERLCVNVAMRRREADRLGRALLKPERARRTVSAHR